MSFLRDWINSQPGKRLSAIYISGLILILFVVVTGGFIIQPTLLYYCNHTLFILSSIVIIKFCSLVVCRASHIWIVKQRLQRKYVIYPDKNNYNQEPEKHKKSNKEGVCSIVMVVFTLSDINKFARWTSHITHGI